MGRLEGHVLNGIELVLKHFPNYPMAVPGSTSNSSGIEKVTHKDAQNILANRSKSLLGRPREGRTTRIMVTLAPDTRHDSNIDFDSIIVGRVSPQSVDLEVTSGDKMILLKSSKNEHPSMSANEYDQMMKIQLYHASIY